MKKDILPSLVLLTCILMTGCAHRFHPGKQQVGDWGPSTFLEDGKPVKLYTRDIMDYHGPGVVYNSNLGVRSAILTEKPSKLTAAPDVAYTNDDVDKLWSTTPDWRREEKLRVVSQRLTADQPPALDRCLV